jgi:hypothetical protein
LELLHVQITQAISGKGTPLLGGCDQPGQDRMGIDLEDPSRGADTETFSSTRQDPYNPLQRGLFAVEERARSLQKISLTRGTVELAPGAAPG